MKMGPIGCPETSVINYHYSLHHKPHRLSFHRLILGSFRVWYISSPLCRMQRSYLSTVLTTQINEACRLWRCSPFSSHLRTTHDEGFPEICLKSLPNFYALLSANIRVDLGQSVVYSYYRN